MKKVLNIILAVVLIATCVFGMVGCKNPNEKTTKTGLVYTKVDGVYEIVKYVADGEKTLTIEIEGVTEGIKIRKNAFAGNSTLRKIIVTSAVSEIAEKAFAKMSALEELELPFVGRFAYSDAMYKETGSATSADKKAVDEERTIGYIFGDEYYDGSTSQTINYGTGTINCYMPKTLKKVVINPKSTYSIPWCAFSGATKLQEVSLLGDIDAIGENAFEGTLIRNLTIPASVKTIHKNAFLNASIETVIFADDATDVKLLEKAFFGCSKLVFLGKGEAQDKVIDLSVFSEIAKNALDTQNGVDESIVKTYTVNGKKDSFDLTSIFGKTNVK